MATQEARDARQTSVDRILFRAQLQGMSESDKATKRILLKADLLGACVDFKNAQKSMWDEEALAAKDKKNKGPEPAPVSDPESPIKSFD